MTAPVQDPSARPWLRTLPGRTAPRGAREAEDHAIGAAVTRAVAYADVFDWPLTPAEVHRYLQVPASPVDVMAALAALDVTSRTIRSSEGFVTLAGRERLVATRRERERRSRALWPRAARYARAVAALPFVRMVAVTGSLAVDAATGDADVDLLVVTEDGRLWLTRALAMGIVRGASVRGLDLCPNYLLAQTALRIDERNLFTAHELAQMVPVTPSPVYRALMQQNAWYLDFLPNALPREPLAGVFPRKWVGMARRAAEAPLRATIVDRLEGWEMRRKMVALSAASSSSETRYDAIRCKGHADEHGRRVLAAYEERLRRLAGEA